MDIEDHPPFRRRYGIKPLRCKACGAVYYRERWFAPALCPSYKGEEIIRVEFCGALNPDPDSYAGLCRGELEIIPGGMFDLLPEGFEIDMEMFTHGDQRKVRVASLSELRKIERESQRKADDGIGTPLVWRDLTQDRSNRDVNALRNSSYETGRATPLSKRSTTSGLPITGSVLDTLPE